MKLSRYALVTRVISIDMMESNYRSFGVHFIFNELNVARLIGNFSSLLASKNKVEVFDGFREIHVLRENSLCHHRDGKQATHEKCLECHTAENSSRLI